MRAASRCGAGDTVLPVVGVCFCLRDGDRVLLEARREGLMFPGGRVEQGESPSEALSRELEEELGIVKHAVTPLPLVPAVGAVGFVQPYRVHHWVGELPVTILGTGALLEWCDLEYLLSRRDLLPAVWTIAAMLYAEERI